MSSRFRWVNSTRDSLAMSSWASTTLCKWIITVFHPNRSDVSCSNAGKWLYVRYMCMYMYMKVRYVDALHTYLHARYIPFPSGICQNEKRQTGTLPWATTCKRIRQEEFFLRFRFHSSTCYCIIRRDAATFVQFCIFWRRHRTLCMGFPDFSAFPKASS